MKHHITVSAPVERTPRVAILEGMFDMQPSRRTEHEWDVHLPIEPKCADYKPWNVGLIVGPSGSGKSTIASILWPEQHGQQCAGYSWSATKAVIDHFETLPMKETVALLNSIGFSSPPSWLKPFHVLSTGEQFRVTVARLLADAMVGAWAARASETGVAVIDEFTSVVDRTVAKIGSHCVQRTVRAHGLKFVAVTCHEDVEDWLQPDWVYRPASNTFHWRLLRPGQQQRPHVPLKIERVHHSAWQLFSRHHYLDKSLNPSAVCFYASWDDRPVAFSAWLSQPHGTIPNMRRVSRVVVLPDYQGIGIGERLDAFGASVWKAMGYRGFITASHPAVIASRAKSPEWLMVREPSRTARYGFKPGGGGGDFNKTGAYKRLTVGFEYVGPAMSRAQAECVLGRSTEHNLSRGRE